VGATEALVLGRRQPVRPARFSDIIVVIEQFCIVDLKFCMQYSM
jgi:hypothetical protein